MAGAQGRLLETAASATGRGRAHCPVVVFTGPGPRLPSPRRTGVLVPPREGVLPAPGGGQLALRLGLQPDKTSGDILPSKSRPTCPPPPTGTAAPATALAPSAHSHTREDWTACGPAVRAEGCAPLTRRTGRGPAWRSGPLRSWVRQARLNRLGGWRRYPGCSDEPE